MGTLIRLPDWQPRLHAWLRQINGRAFVPGQHDCCLFGAGAIEAQTGIDIAASWRGRYTTLAGGRRVLRKAGFADHVALIEASLPEIHASRAREGDLALVPVDSELAVGVSQGSALYILTQSGRLGFVPLTSNLRMFEVGSWPQ